MDDKKNQNDQLSQLKFSPKVLKKYFKNRFEKKFIVKKIKKKIFQKNTLTSIQVWTLLGILV